MATMLLSSGYSISSTMPAENIASNWIHRLRSVVWLLSLIDIILLKGNGGNAADIALNCPDPFREGQINIITCAVNSTSIQNAGCIFPPSRLDITFTFTSGSPLSLCSPQYPPTSCGQNSIAQACFCADNSADVFTYQYNFLGDRSYDGGDFMCNICTSPLRPPTREISQNCTTIGFETTTTTTTTTTATTTNTTAVTANSSTITTETPKSPKPEEWGIPTVVVQAIFSPTGVIILALIIWTIMIRKFCLVNQKIISKINPEPCGIAGIVISVLILVLGIITVIVASIKSKTSKDGYFIASIVLGCFCMAIGVVNVILIILIKCGCIKPNKKVTEPSTDASDQNSKTSTPL